MDDAAIRVLLILENAGSGSGRHVIDLARGLLARGHEVTLLFSRSRLEGWFQREIAALDGLRTATIDMRPGLSIQDAAAVIAVRKFVKFQGPFDVIHGHSSKAGALARVGALGLPGVRVYTPHAFYTLGAANGSLRSYFYAALERCLARAGAGIICVSEAEHDHALLMGLPADKLFTVPNGFDFAFTPRHEEVRRRLGLTEDQVCVGFVGRLSRQKSVHRLLEAFAIAEKTRSGCRLVIVGFGPDEDKLKSTAQRLGIGDSVIWTGEASGIELMSAFDVFALPSLYEAFPYVLLEALAHGLPVVSMRVGGVDELIRENINGHVVEQDDISTMGAKLASLIANPALRDAMGNAARNIVADFGTDTMVSRTEAVYRNLLSRVNLPAGA